MRSSHGRFTEETGRQFHRASESRNFGYISGTAVPVITPEIQRKEKRRIREKHIILKNREKVHHMNIGFVSVMVFALATASVILFSYIHLQSDVTNRVTNIARLERQLNNLKLSNEEEYNRIMGDVDLEEIKRIAINDLGMKYAKDGQVVTYTGEGSDYVRQYSEIP